MFDGMTLAMNDVTSSGTGIFSLPGFFPQNGFARLEIGRLDIGEQSPLESRTQARFQRLDLLRRTVGGDDQLAARFVQRVERMEELFLRRLFAGEKLNVVDQQHVDLAIAIAKLRRAIVLQRDDELVGELLARDVDDVGSEVVLNDAMADRVHEVGLSQADAAVEKERIVGVRRGAGDGLRRGVGEPVGVADDKLFKSITCIKVGDTETLQAVALQRRPPPLRPASVGSATESRKLDAGVPKSSLKTPII